MIRLVCLAALALCLAGCGGGYGHTMTSDGPAARPVPAEATTISGGTAAQRAIVHDALDRLEATGIERISIEPPGDEWKPHGADDVMLRMSWDDQDDVETQWEASIVAGAFAARSTAEGLPELVAFHWPGGGSRVSGVPGEDGHPPPRPPAPDATAVDEAVRAAAAKQGATIARLATAVIDGRPVVRLGLEMDGDPAQFLMQRVPLILAALPSTLGGRHVELYAGAERIFMTGQYTAGEVRGGMGWTRPDLDSCSPIFHSQPAGAQPPPCPFEGPRVLAREAAAPSQDVEDGVRAATAHAQPGERVTLLDVGPDAQALCTGWRVDCPSGSHRTAWLALIAPRTEESAATRFVLIDDSDGRVVGSGPLP